MSRRPGFYERVVFPWLNEKLTNVPELLRMRSDALASARGRVLEIGFGSGANLPHYPPAVDAVVAVEPNEGMYARAGDRLRAFGRPVEWIASGAEGIDVVDRSADTAVSTLTLCSVADPQRALAELRRVLRDDGRLIVLEHGLSPDAAVARWQRRLNRMQNVVACGCHLTRPIIELVEGQGFRFDSLQTFYSEGLPRTHGWITVGAAVKSESEVARATTRDY
jgi:ubiquinone/menaquinone biosynthesis C-methylase UbiE